MIDFRRVDIRNIDRLDSGEEARDSNADALEKRRLDSIVRCDAIRCDICGVAVCGDVVRGDGAAIFCDPDRWEYGLRIGVS